MSVETRPLEWTYENYLGLPEGGPLRYEVNDGELYMTPSPGIRHQRISGRIFHFVTTFLIGHPLGEIFIAPCDVIFSRDPLQYVEPDLVYVARERAGIVTEKNIQGVPDLVVEILSEGTLLRDRREKLRLYERFGVPEYWIVDPESEMVQSFILADGTYPSPREFSREKGEGLQTRLLPGLTIPLADIFS